jgi:hypothetical protein
MICSLALRGEAAQLFFTELDDILHRRHPLSVGLIYLSEHLLPAVETAGKLICNSSRIVRTLDTKALRKDSRHDVRSA